MECCSGWCHGTLGPARSSAAAVNRHHGASGWKKTVAAWRKSIRRRRRRLPRCAGCGALVNPERRSELVEDTPSLAEAILDQIADAVIFADATGTIRRWNRG